MRIIMRMKDWDVLLLGLGVGATLGRRTLLLAWDLGGAWALAKNR